MESAGRERGKGFEKLPADGAKRQENPKKILNRGNKLKDFLKTHHLAFFRAKNKLKTNSILSAKSGKKREQGRGNREQSSCLAAVAP
jgi:hypothetical protein